MLAGLFEQNSQHVCILVTFLSLLELEFRLDYQLKQGKMEYAYISAITSHTSYWMNQDVNLFMISNLFPEAKVT